MGLGFITAPAGAGEYRSHSRYFVEGSQERNNRLIYSLWIEEELIGSFLELLEIAVRDSVEHVRSF